MKQNRYRKQPRGTICATVGFFRWRAPSAVRAAVDSRERTFCGRWYAGGLPVGFWAWDIHRAGQCTGVADFHHFKIT